MEHCLEKICAEVQHLTFKHTRENDLGWSMMCIHNQVQIGNFYPQDTKNFLAVAFSQCPHPLQKELQKFKDIMLPFQRNLGKSQGSILGLIT